MTILKRCFCGKFRRYGNEWTKPDSIQLSSISIALTKKEVKIVSEMCPGCSDAFRGFEERMEARSDTIRILQEEAS